MGKGLAVTGLVLSLIFPIILIFGKIVAIGGYSVFYLIMPIGLPSTIIGFIMNLIILIKKFDGKKLAIIGLAFNIIVIIFIFIRNIISIF